MINIEAGKLSGIITVFKGKDPDNTVEVAKFPNMILNAGLVEFGKSTTYISYCNVGSSGVAVSASQTGLQNKLRHSNTQQAQTVGANNDDPATPYIWRRRTIRFAPSGSAYNVAEIGFGWDVNNNCFNRALVLQDGLPSVISVLGDEYLDVQLEVRLYPPVTDFTGTLTPTGKDTAPRDWVARATSFIGASGELNYDTVGVSWSLNGGAYSIYNYSGASPNNLPVLFGNLGNLTISSNSTVTTTLGISEHTNTVYFDLNTNNTNLTRTVIHVGGCHEFSIEFDPPFQKTADDELTISFKYTWGRKE